MTIDLRVSLGIPPDGSFELHVNPEAAPRLRAALEAAGLDVSEGFEHADATGKPYTVLLISAVAAALPALARVLEVVLQQHDKKHFTIGQSRSDRLWWADSSGGRKEFCELL